MREKRLTRYSIAIILSVFFIVANINTTHAQITAQTVSNSIGSGLKKAVNSTKENAAKNGLMRNELVNDHSADIQEKENLLTDELNATLLALENIQSRIALKTSEIASSTPEIDTSDVGAWLATSSQDMMTAQDDISLFASITNATSSSPQTASVTDIRKLADTTIRAVNKAHDDLQSTLDALTKII